MLRVGLLLGFGAACAVAACGGNAQGTGSGGGSGGCVYAGVPRDRGESFPAGDGCNTCSCERGGTVACTQADCAPTCEYLGETHFVGESFPAGDGCNTCSCDVSGSVACTNRACATPSDQACLYRGVFHAVGESFPAGDGCNTCDCVAKGSVGCTKIGCLSACVDEGVTYGPGSTWRAADGCNDCQCAVDPAGAPTVQCSIGLCACDPDLEWFRSYVGNSPDECAAIDFDCAGETRIFSNSCGCGCEQASWCPQTFDCGAVALCDPEQIEAQCPFSEIVGL